LIQWILAKYEYLRTLFIAHPKEMLGYLTGAGGAVTWLVKRIEGFRQKRKNRKLDRNLHPFLSAKALRYITSYYINQRLVHTSLGNFNEPAQITRLLTKKNTTSFDNFLREIRDVENDQQYFAILGDSGAGKTTLLAKTFERFNDLRKKEYKIKLIPLDNPLAIDEIKKLEPTGENTILLLDAFDELKQAGENKTTLNDLVQMTPRFRMVILTCRTQFFESQKKEPDLTTFPDITINGYKKFQKYYVAPFSDKDVKRLIRKIFPFYKWNKRIEAKDIVKHAPNLMVRPFIIKNIEYLIGSPEIKNTELYSFKVYEILVRNWIERDLKIFSNPEEREKYSKAALPLMLDLARASFSHFHTEEVLYLTHNEIEEIAAKYGIRLDFIKVRTLLNRENNGNIKFAHKSVYEFLIAKLAIKDRSIHNSLRNDRRYDMANHFLNEHYFFTGVRKLIETSEGSFYQNDQKMQLTALTITSFFKIRTIRIDSYSNTEYLESLFRFRHLNLIVVNIQTAGLSLCMLYHLFYCYSSEAFEFIDEFISYANATGAELPAAWGKWKRNLYDTNRLWFSRKTYEKDKKYYFYTGRSINREKKIYTGIRPELKSIIIADTNIIKLCCFLYDNKLDNIVYALSRVQFTDLRMLLDKSYAAMNWFDLGYQERNEMETLLREMVEYDESAFVKLDALVDNFTKILRPADLQIIY